MALREALTSTKTRDAGILLLRVWLGIMMIDHGVGKVFGDNTKFVNGVAEMGFPAPELFAWAAALSEFAGGILLIVGLFVRPVSLLIAITMAVAAFIRHADDEWGVQEKPIAYMAMALAIALLGPDRFTLDRRLFSRRGKGVATR